MPQFDGFSSSETFTSLPDSLFRLLGEIDDLNELKLTLYVLWRIEHMEGAFRRIRREEIMADTAFTQTLSAAAVDSGLEKAVRRGTLLRVGQATGGSYFLNSPRGRAAAEALKKGQWRETARSEPAAPGERPNIFKLYEENIGPLTPLLADALKDAEQDYPAALIEAAFAEAVKLNKRNWKYIEAILKRWKEEGRGEKQDRRNAEKDHGRDVERKVEAFLKRSR